MFLMLPYFSYWLKMWIIIHCLFPLMWIIVFAHYKLFRQNIADIELEWSEKRRKMLWPSKWLNRNKYKWTYNKGHNHSTNTPLNILIRITTQEAYHKGLVYKLNHPTIEESLNKMPSSPPSLQLIVGAFTIIWANPAKTKDSKWVLILMLCIF
jgi:hypothetical protein